MALKVSPKVREKLANKVPPVTPEEVMQCFATRSGCYLEDIREQHVSNPPTRWFVSETFFGRKLKIVYIFRDGDMHLRTAYPPNAVELEIYKNNCP